MKGAHPKGEGSFKVAVPFPVLKAAGLKTQKITIEQGNENRYLPHLDAAKRVT
jgi:hypothetical protein